MEDCRINGMIVASFDDFIEANNGFDFSERAKAWVRDMDPGQAIHVPHRGHGFAVLSYGRPGARMEFVSTHLERVADSLKSAGQGMREGRSVTNDLDDALYHAVQADMPDLRAFIVGLLGED